MMAVERKVQIQRWHEEGEIKCADTEDHAFQGLVWPSETPEVKSLVRKVDSDGEKMVSSVGTRCLQNSPSGNIQCKAGNKGLQCKREKLVLDAPFGNHIHPRAIWPEQVSQNQLLCSDAPRVSIYNILDLAKHKAVDDKAHKEGSFTSNFFFPCEKQFRHLSSDTRPPLLPPLTDSIWYKHGSLCQNPEGLLTHLKTAQRNGNFLLQHFLE